MNQDQLITLLAVSNLDIQDSGVLSFKKQPDGTIWAVESKQITWTDSDGSDCHVMFGPVIKIDKQGFYSEDESNLSKLILGLILGEQIV